MTGKLITFEGGEGAGKTTQVALLAEYLQKKGEKVVVAREPGGVEIAEQIRKILLDKKNVKMYKITEALLYQAARAQVYHELVRPALERGEIVLMDRSRDSSVVYQGIVRGLGVALIEKLNDISTEELTPNLTFLLDVPVEIGLHRKSDDEVNRLELEGKKFHEKVNKAYLKLHKLDGFGRIIKINAKNTVEKVFEQVVKHYEKYQ